MREAQSAAAKRRKLDVCDTIAPNWKHQLPFLLRDSADTADNVGLPISLRGDHLRFAQRRGMSQKVSDEYVVPLCALHRSSNEQEWWERQKN
jgi:hypothetical protein